MTGSVTIDNDPSDPIPVNGSVAASQDGAWTVGLDSTSAGYLGNIDAAT